MAYRVVCISYVMAGGGEPIGQLLAERLGFRYVDSEIIALAAERAGLEPAVVRDVEQHKGLLARLTDALIAPPTKVQSYLSRHGYYAEGAPTQTPPPAEELRRLIQEAIFAIAERGNVVIVAHGASMALAGRPDVLRIHVTASVATRIARLWAPNKLISEEEYAKAIAESDHQRAMYLARFYDIHEESPTRYDLVVNTDALGLEPAVAAIAGAVSA